MGRVPTSPRHRYLRITKKPIDAPPDLSIWRPNWSQLCTPTTALQLACYATPRCASGKHLSPSSAPLRRHFQEPTDVFFPIETVNRKSPHRSTAGVNKKRNPTKRRYPTPPSQRSEKFCPWNRSEEHTSELQSRQYLV